MRIVLIHKLTFSLRRTRVLSNMISGTTLKKQKQRIINLEQRTRFEAIDYILKRIDVFDEEIKHKIFVAINRFIKASKQDDISMKIVLYHVVFTHLLSILSNKYPKLSQISHIQKIFDEIEVEYDEEILKNIVKFNLNRNKAFKNVKSNL